MNHRGFLLAEEVVKIVIALICLGFLVYFLTSLYLSRGNDEELEQAEATLERLVEEYNSAESKSISFEVYSPKGWIFYSWFETDLPDKCLNSGWTDCLCICDPVLLSGELDECDTNGVCVESNLQVSEGVLEINKVPKTLTIENGVIK